MGFRLAYLYLAMTHSKGQGHAYFDDKYFENGDKQGKNHNCHQIQGHMCAFYWNIYILTLAHSKGQGQDHAHFDNNYLGNGDR